MKNTNKENKIVLEQIKENTKNRKLGFIEAIFETDRISKEWKAKVNKPQ
jgi:hypothetical protein